MVCTHALVLHPAPWHTQRQAQNQLNSAVFAGVPALRIHTRCDWSSSSSQSPTHHNTHTATISSHATQVHTRTGAKPGPQQQRNWRYRRLQTTQLQHNHHPASPALPPAVRAAAAPQASSHSSNGSPAQAPQRQQRAGSVALGRRPGREVGLQHAAHASNLHSCSGGHDHHSRTAAPPAPGCPLPCKRDSKGCADQHSGRNAKRRQQRSVHAPQQRQERVLQAGVHS